MVLYRKYRPQIFDDIYGQEHVVRTLRNQILTNRIAHAYLFYGSRGTGKTTIARIFAKAINCNNRDEDCNPCLKCESCDVIANNLNSDFVEIDAASNNSVDNVRDLIDECKYATRTLKYKVYIIDEVHMLSNSAFNALLKTLEDPPAHVIFILATTERNKVPATIASRCQHFCFHMLSNDEIRALLQDVSIKEGRNIDSAAIDMLVEMSKGGMRDALSYLDQVISFCEEETITVDDVTDIFGLPNSSYVEDIYNTILRQDVASATDLINDAYGEGKSLIDLCAMLYKYAKDRVLDDNSYLRYMRIFGELYSSIKHASMPLIAFEIALARACIPEMDGASSQPEKIQKEIEELDYFVMNNAVIPNVTVV